MEHDSHQLVRAFLYAPFPVLIHNECGEVKLVNERWIEITGYTPDEISTISRWTELAYGKKQERVKSDIDNLFSVNKVVSEGEYTIRCKDGSQRVWQFSSGPLGKDENGHRLVISMAVDVTERKKLERRLLKQATHDGLTGLFNHNAIIERLDNEVERAKRYQRSLSVLLIDLDKFKVINDKYGHVTGDAVLSSIAALIKQAIRTTDYAARYGGEEFVIVLPETANEKAYEFGRRLCDLISQHIIRKDNTAISVTASIGIATFPENASDGLALLDAADAAMYQVKASGRNNVQLAG